MHGRQPDSAAAGWPAEQSLLRLDTVSRSQDIVTADRTAALEFFQDSSGRSPVVDWIEHDLTNVELAALLAGLEHVLSHRGIAVSATEWGKQLGDGLFEFRIRHSAAEIEHMFSAPRPAEQPAKGQKVVLRVFCHAYGAKVVLLLNGYDKGADPSGRRQNREIAVARQLLTEFKERSDCDPLCQRRRRQA
jgi:hypothetical protein